MKIRLNSQDRFFKILINYIDHSKSDLKNFRTSIKTSRTNFGNPLLVSIRYPRNDLNNTYR